MKKWTKTRSKKEAEKMGKKSGTKNWPRKTKEIFFFTPICSNTAFRMEYS